MTACDTSEAARWLMEGARSAHLPEDVLQQLCERMVAAGVPLAGAAGFLLKPPPRVFCRRLVLRAGVLAHGFPISSATPQRTAPPTSRPGGAPRRGGVAR